MRTVTLVSLGLGGAGVATGAGFAISSYIGGESIKEHIERTSQKSNKVFLTSDNTELTEIKKKYTESTNSKRPKPKKDGVEVKAEELAKWCEDSIKEKFSNEDSDTYKGIISWCYINTNSFDQELMSNGGKGMSKKAVGETIWTTAWNSYSVEKNNSALKIEDAESALNEAQATAGAKALHTWCTKKSKIKLYEDYVEKTYSLFARWCPKE